jgi:PPK2 family polyphosphate:nucleotide phosphotransferase
MVAAPRGSIMRIDQRDFLVRPGQVVDLVKRPTEVDPFYDSKDDYQRKLDKHTSELSKLQNVLYAHNRFSVLLIFQAMDAAGKDSAIKHVMSGVNPQGCQVTSFKHPSSEELEHDFLWRTTQHLPERGMIGIFNRSYYEEVLIARVHPKILAAQALPEKLANPRMIWADRYRSIVDFERHLQRNGTVVVKFFLHLSRNEQRKRFLDRIDDPEKNWKFDFGDLDERKCWKEYMKAYAQCLQATSTAAAPWYAVPADDKKNMRLIISRIIVDTIAGLDLHYPRLSAESLEKIRLIRAELEK